MRQAFIGVDVGTSSARAGVFDEKGSLLATARHPITVWHEAGSVVEQSSSQIWAACAASVRAAMAEAAIPPSAVGGLWEQRPHPSQRGWKGYPSAVSIVALSL